MAAKKKVGKNKINPATGNPFWVDELQVQIHPDHRVEDGWEKQRDHIPEGYDPYHGYALDGISY